MQSKSARPIARPESILQSVPTDKSEAAAAFVGIGANDVDAMLRRVGGNHITLVCRRISLVVGRHADVLRGTIRPSDLLFECCGLGAH